MIPVLAALAVFAAAGVAALAAGRRPALALWIGSAGAVLGAALGLAGVLPVLLGAAGSEWSSPWSVPLGSFRLRLDPLASFFLAALYAIAIPASVYGVGYLGHHRGGRSLAAFVSFFNLLLASLSLVFAASDGVLFLVAWEIMTVATFALVTFDDEQAEVRSAGYTFLVASHLGTAFLFALFVLLGRSAGGFDFARFEALRGAAPVPLLLFLLGLVGFGTKAGLFPLHVWLPEAHPAAPSHVSAVLSAVMIKTGVYGLLRLLGFLPPAGVGVGVLLGVAGLASALLGITLALGQADIKRALAYSSVENVGIVLLGIGLGVVGSATGMPAVATLGYCGALFHVWSHAVMKGLAFMGAGALASATRTRDLERMGGLLARLPLSGSLFLVGAAALSALPPLSGFASEWLVYLGLLEAAQSAPGAGSLLGFLAVAVLALVGTLAAVSFTRLCGIALLGVPRSPEAASAREPSALLWGPLAALAAGSLALGVFPAAALRLVAPVAGEMGGAPAGAAVEAATRLARPLSGTAIVLLLAGGIAAFTARRVRSAREVRPSETWGCGFGHPSARMEYTASSYAQFLLSGLVPRALQPRVRLKPPRGVFPGASSLGTEAQDPARTRLFDPLFRGLGERMSRLRRFQAGRLNLQLLYTLVTLVALGVALALRARFG